MAYAELVKYIGVEDRDVSQDEVRGDDLEEDIGTDITCTRPFVVAEGLAVSPLKRRQDQLLVNRIEVNNDCGLLSPPSAE